MPSNTRARLAPTPCVPPLPRGCPTRPPAPLPGCPCPLALGARHTGMLLGTNLGGGKEMASEDRQRLLSLGCCALGWLPVPSRSLSLSPRPVPPALSPTDLHRRGCLISPQGAAAPALTHDPGVGNSPCPQIPVGGTWGLVLTPPCAGRALGQWWALVAGGAAPPRQGCQPGACSCPCSGLICGAITSQYLLEKSRVVFQVGGGPALCFPMLSPPVSPPQLGPLLPRPRASATTTSSTRCWPGCPPSSGSGTACRAPRPTTT